MPCGIFFFIFLINKKGIEIMTKYKLINDGCIGYTTNGTEFYFDQKNVEKVVAHNWYINDNGFVTLDSKKHPDIYLHEYIMNETDPNVIVYHIDGNKLNNRKSNLSRITNTKCNQYEITDDGVIGYTRKGEMFYFDREDLPRVAKHNWNINSDGYVYTHICIDNNKRATVSLSRYLLNVFNRNMTVYYVDGNPLNNHKSNLERKRVARGPGGPNQFAIADDCVIGRTAKGDVFYFDKEDIHKVTAHTWCLSRQGYVVSTVYDDSGRTKKLRLHRYLMDEIDPNIFIDHIDGNPLNNRKSNLRRTTPAQNAQNHKMSKANTSGANGVYWNKRNKRWCALISINSKLTYLGYFDTKEEAIQARKKAEEKYYGEYTRK